MDTPSYVDILFRIRRLPPSDILFRIRRPGPFDKLTPGGSKSR
jgi:hypothetical protein